MSVVAGISVLDGILLLADCRGTVEYRGRPSVYVDNLQKIFVLPGNTVIGYVGDVKAAGLILREMIYQADKINRRNPMTPLSILDWLPRFLPKAYRSIPELKNKPVVQFMVGSVLTSRQAVVRRSKAIDLLDRFRTGQLGGQRNFLPGIFMKILQTPPETEFINISDFGQGLMYVMSSPDFKPIHFETLEGAAIGSGQGSIVQIDKEADLLFALQPGNAFVEGFEFRRTVMGYINQAKVDSVGGLYLCLKISKSGIEDTGFRMTMPAKGVNIELSFRSSDLRWVQRNVSENREITLIRPWEVNPRDYVTDNKFDDVIKAYRQQYTEKGLESPW